MASLDLSKIHIRNFRSYGDYDTEIDLDNLGPVLILGETTSNPEKSNGAGKSTIADAIVWCLFGRIPAKQRPAAHIVNKNVGKDCCVRITTRDGYVITRTRNMAGHNDLLIQQPDGEDISDSTNKNAQQHLDKIFNLDYDIFISSVFFAQFGGTFLELPDPKRKKAMERMLHQDKYDHYAAVCKEQTEALTAEHAIHNKALEIAKQAVLDRTLELQQNQECRKRHEKDRDSRVVAQNEILDGVDDEFRQKEVETRNSIQQAQQELDAIQLYDIDQLTLEWNAHGTILFKLDEAQKRLQNIYTEIARLKTKKETLEGQSYIVDDDRLQQLQERLEQLKIDFRGIVTYDQILLKKQWASYNEKVGLIGEVNQKIQAAESELGNVTARIVDKEMEIKSWKEKIGKICPTCAQEIRQGHILCQCESPSEALKKLNIQKDSLRAKCQKFREIRDKVQAVEPPVTLTEASLIQEHLESKEAEIRTVRESIDHIKSQIEDGDKAEEDRLQEIQELLENIRKKEEYVENKKKEIADKRLAAIPPSVTINEAQTVKAGYDAKAREITILTDSLSTLNEQKEASKKRIREEIQRIKDEKNPYDDIIDKLGEALEKAKNDRDDSQRRVGQYNQLIKHVDYIRSAYSDRRKIKAHVLSKFIPYFNERIAYYLDQFECGYRLEFTSTLQTKSELWPYEMWSGGERKKIDLAVMFAMHDLHISLYDQQCNILVFDEVDGRLDLDGIKKFTEILLNELTTNQRTILVISHKDAMRDAIPTILLVQKDEDGCSHVREIR